MLELRSHLKNQIEDWVRGRFQAAQATWLNKDSLLYGLRWIKAESGEVRLKVASQWLGHSPPRYTGSLILACEWAVEQALSKEERMEGVGLLFMGSQSEFLKAQRGACEIRFKISTDEMEQIRHQVLKEKTLSREFVLTLWSDDEAHLGSVTLQVRLQLQPYLTA